MSALLRSEQNCSLTKRRMNVAWKQVGVPGFGIQTRVFLELASGGTFGGTYIRHIEYSVIFSTGYLSDANSVGAN